MMPAIEQGLIESTLRNLREHRHSLEEERTKIERKIAEVTANIHKWERELHNGEWSVETAEGGSPQRRKKRGENSRIVREYFESHPGALLSIPEIGEITGLSHSSVHTVVTKGTGTYEKVGEKWRMVQNANSPLSS